METWEERVREYELEKARGELPKQKKWYPLKLLGVAIFLASFFLPFGIWGYVVGLIVFVTAICLDRM